MKNLNYLFLLCLMYAIQVFFVTSASATDIKQSLAYAFAYSPNLQMMQEAREQATHNVRSAEAGYYPTIGIWGGGGIFQESTQTTREFKESGKVLGNTGLGLTFSQTIWQGGATSAMVRSRKAGLEASIFDILDNATALAYNTISTHADLLRRKTLVDLSKKNVLYHEKILKILKARFAQDLSSRGDVEQVVSRLSRAKAILATHKEGLNAAFIGYRRITGQHAPQNILPVPVPTQIFDNSLTVRDLSVQHNYSLKSLISQINALIAERDFSRSSFAPNFTLDAGPSYQNIDRGIGGDTYTLTWDLMLNMSWNLYDGGANLANFEVNSAKVREARKALHATMDALDEQINLAYYRTMTAGEHAIYYGEASVASGLASDNFLIQFKAGQKDLLSVLDAETEYFTASVEKIVALTDSTLGQYRMHALAGTLLSAVDIDMSAISKGKPVRTALDDVTPWSFTPSPADTSSGNNGSILLRD